MRGRTAQRISTPKVQSRTLPAASGPGRRQLDFREFSPMTLSRAAVGQQMVPIVTRNTTGRQTVSAALNPSGDRHGLSNQTSVIANNEAAGALEKKQEVVSAWPIL